MPSAKKLDISEPQIATRAYERWMGRGCPVSDGADDWFAARHELEAEFATVQPVSARRAKAKSMRHASATR
jgi:hypothetical protein